MKPERNQLLLCIPNAGNQTLTSQAEFHISRSSNTLDEKDTNQMDMNEESRSTKNMHTGSDR